MSSRSYRVYTKRKLLEDPNLEKGFTKKTKKQKEIDDDETLRVKYISKSECQQLDKVLDENERENDGNFISFKCVN